MTTQPEKTIELTKKDRLAVAWRRTFVQANWNYERMHNVGFAYQMAPIIRKLYKSKEEQSEALQRHLEFVNTHPYLYGPINGVVLALEEQKANGADIPDQTIQGVKIGMMGPLAGVGDPIFWGTLRPVLGAFAASLALSGSGLGPIIFFLAWNVIRFGFTWYTQELGYRSGTEITKDLSGGILQKITTVASILGMFIMGVLVPRWTSMNFPVILSSVKVDSADMVNFAQLAEEANNNMLTTDTLRDITMQIQNGLSLTDMNVQTLQDVLNQLLPGLMPLLLTFLSIWLLRKNVSAITIILGIFVLGILMFSLGIMA